MMIAVTMLLAVVAVVVTRPVAQSPVVEKSRPPVPASNHQAFGGYIAVVAIHQISATWVIPKIASRSKDGVAATWVGATNTANDFVQLGNTEIKSNGHSSYETFYSGTAYDDKAQNMISVSAGDTVNFSMTQSTTGWSFVIDDFSSNKIDKVSIQYARGAAYTQASWLQEAPDNGADPYPKLSPTRFSQIELNAGPAKLPFSDGQTLSAEPGAYYVPTRVVDGAFSIRPATGYARQYLSDVQPYDLAVDELSVTAKPAVYSDKRVNGVIVALGKLVRAFSTQQWPKSVEKYLPGFERANRQNLIFFEKYKSAPLSKKHAVLAQQARASSKMPAYAVAIRTALGLPPPAR
jgi:hypothetical protein